MFEILIVEDEIVIANDLKMTLAEIGFNAVGIAISAKEALNFLASGVKVDLVLIDITIKGERDGIALASDIKNQHNIPYIFITSHSDNATIERAIATKPSGYILKPFEKTDIYTSIRLALTGEEEYSEGVLKNNESTPSLKSEDKAHIYIKDQYKYIKIKFTDLNFIRGVGNYIELHCDHKKFLIKTTLKNFYARLNNRQFLQVHKSYIVNLERIDSFNKNFIYIDNNEIPVGKVYCDDFFSAVDIF